MERQQHSSVRNPLHAFPLADQATVIRSQEVAPQFFHAGFVFEGSDTCITTEDRIVSSFEGVFALLHLDQYRPTTAGCIPLEGGRQSQPVRAFAAVDHHRQGTRGHPNHSGTAVGRASTRSTCWVSDCICEFMPSIQACRACESNGMGTGAAGGIGSGGGGGCPRNG